MTYVIAIGENGWEQTAAKTLAAAKAEATRRLRSTWRDDFVVVGMRHKDGQIQSLAYKVNAPIAKWRNI